MPNLDIPSKFRGFYDEFLLHCGSKGKKGKKGAKDVFFEGQNVNNQAEIYRNHWEGWLFYLFLEQEYRRKENETDKTRFKGAIKKVPKPRKSKGIQEYYDFDTLNKVVENGDGFASGIPNTILEELAKEFEQDLFPLFIEFLKFCDGKAITFFYEIPKPDTPSTREEAEKQAIQKLSDKIFELENYKPGSPISNPYKGLAHFTKNDAGIFFGRKDEIAQLVEKIKTHAFIVVKGASGSGKSSLVMAGVIPELEKKHNYLSITLTPKSGANYDPFSSLANAIITDCNRHTSTEETELLEKRSKLESKLRQQNVDLGSVIDVYSKHQQKVLLVIDQFEEILDFNTGDESDRYQAFLALLMRSYERMKGHKFPAVSIVLTFRHDFIGQFDGETEFSNLLVNNEYGLTQLDKSYLPSVIKGPLSDTGTQIDDTLVEAILRDAKNTKNFLPLVEFTLTKLWEEKKENRLSLEAYEKLGRLTGGLQKHAEELFSALSEPKQLAAESLFIKLIRLGAGDDTNTKKRLFYSYEKDNQSLSKDEWALAQKLAGSAYTSQLYVHRILVIAPVNERAESGPQTFSVEIVHDVLIQEWKRLGDWINKHRDFLAWHDDFEVYLRAWQQDGTSFLVGSVLEQAIQHKDKSELHLIKQEIEFINSSSDNRYALEAEREIANKRQLKRQRNLTAIAVAVALVMAFLMFRFEQSEREAVQAQERATINGKRLLTEISQQLFDDDEIRLSILTALESLNNNTESQERDEVSYRRALNILKSSVGKYIPVRKIDYLERDLLRAYDITPDLRKMVVVRNWREVSVWDLLKNEIIITLSDTPRIVDKVTIDPAGEFVTLTSHDGLTGQIWDINENKLVTSIGGRDVENILMSSDLSYVLAKDRSGLYTLGFIRPGTSKSMEIFSAKDGEIISLSPDGCCFIHGERGRITRYLLDKDKFKKDITVADPFNSLFAIDHSHTYIIAYGKDGKLRHAKLSEFIYSNHLSEFILPFDLEFDFENLIFDRSGNFFAITDHPENDLPKAHIFHAKTGGYIRKVPFELDDIALFTFDMSSKYWEYLNHVNSVMRFFYPEVAENYLIDLTSGEELQLNIFEDKSRLSGLVDNFLYDGEHLTVVNNDGHIEIFNKIESPLSAVRLPGMYHEAEWCDNATIIAKKRTTIETRTFMEEYSWNLEQLELLEFNREAFYPPTFSLDDLLWDDPNRNISKESVWSTNGRWRVDFDYIMHDHLGSSFTEFGDNVLLSDVNNTRSLVLLEKGLNNYPKFTSDSRYLSFVSDGVFYKWKLSGGEVISDTFEINIGDSGSFDYFYDDGAYYYFIGSDNKFEIRKISSDEMIFSHSIEQGEIDSVKWLEGLKAVMWVESGRTIQIKELFSGKSLFSYDIGTNSVSDIEINPDSSSLLLRESDGTVSAIPIKETSEQEFIDYFRELPLPPFTAEEKARFHLN